MPPIGHVYWQECSLKLDDEDDNLKCVSGKLTWLINRFGSDFTNFIFTRHKDRLAHSNAYLVDDMPFNISSFISRGGNGVLFPQIWNELSHIEDPVSHIINKLKISISQKN